MALSIFSLSVAHYIVAFRRGDGRSISLQVGRHTAMSRRKQSTPRRQHMSSNNDTESTPQQTCYEQHRVGKMLKSHILGPFNVVHYEMDEHASLDATLVKMKDSNGTEHQFKVLNEKDYPTLVNINLTSRACDANAVMFLTRVNSAPEPLNIYVEKDVKTRRNDETTPTGALKLVLLDKLSDNIGDVSIRCYAVCFGITSQLSALQKMSMKANPCRHCHLTSFNSDLSLAGHQSINKDINMSYCDNRMASEAIKDLKARADIENTASKFDVSRLLQSTKNNAELDLYQSLSQLILQQQRQQQNDLVLSQLIREHQASMPNLVNQMIATLPSQPKSILSMPKESNKSMTRNNGDVIYLPVATSSDIQQLVIAGPPQLIVPVIVPKSMQTAKSLLPTVALMTPTLRENKVIDLRIDEHRSIEVKLVGRRANLTRMGSTQSDEQPVDLSKNPHKRRLSFSNGTSKASRLTPGVSGMMSDGGTPNASKPFKCVCGIEFSQEATLFGHQKHYCKMQDKPAAATSVPPDDGDVTPPLRIIQRRRVVDNNETMLCGFCRYKANSTRGLKQHINSQHSEVAFQILGIDAENEANSNNDIVAKRLHDSTKRCSHDSANDAEIKVD